MNIIDSMYFIVDGTNHAKYSSRTHQYSTHHFPDFQKWSLTIRWRLVLYPRHAFFGGGLTLLFRGYGQHILNLADKADYNVNSKHVLR